MNDQPKTIDITWLARITFGYRDQPTSDWLPPGQRLVGARFNDPERPEWMDEPLWNFRHAGGVPPVVRAVDLRLKRILCEGASLTPAVEVRRSDE